MKLPTSPRVMSRRGMTLIETTVILAILIVLVSILFTGTRAWMRGCNRTACILTIRNVQVATRSYQNCHGYTYGSVPTAMGGSLDIGEHLFAMGYIEQRTYDEIRGNTTCPSGGKYFRRVPNLFPPLGSVYLECTLGTGQQHVPSSPEAW